MYHIRDTVLARGIANDYRDSPIHAPEYVHLRCLVVFVWRMCIDIEPNLSCTYSREVGIYLVRKAQLVRYDPVRLAPNKFSTFASN